MGMANNNLCDSCINIGCIFQSGIKRTECAFYIPPHIEPDNCGNYVIQEPKTGQWVKIKPYPLQMHDYECSECGHETDDNTENYCSNCGAKMESEE